MNRYDRQERVRQIGPAGQAKISQATILIVGLGALGSYAASQLVRAGVKRLILVDPDVVTVSNLQRQALYTTFDAAKKRFKVLAAKEHLQAINPTVAVTAIPAPLTTDVIQKQSFDLCLDCLDNYTARDLLNRLAIAQHFDYLFASCAGTYGNVMAVSPRKHPCLNCLFPNLDQLKQADCDVIGVNTALIPVIAGLQVSLALHYLVDRASIDFSRLYTIDNWLLTWNRFKIKKRSDCPTCHTPTDRLLTKLEQEQPELKMLCGEGAFYTTLTAPVDLVSWQEWLKQRSLLVGTSPLFIHFQWQGHPVSLFRTGRLIMYQLATPEAANHLLTSIKQVANEVSKGGQP